MPHNGSNITFNVALRKLDIALTLSYKTINI